jgi:hypothetical protein
MAKLLVETTPMLRDLMVAALTTRGVPRDALEYRWPALPQGVGSPAAGVCIQQAGMLALGRAGIDVAALATCGTMMTRLAILSEAGTGPILEYLPDAGPLPIFLPLAHVRDAMARVAAPAPPMSDAVSPSNDSADEWTSAQCPGILTRVVPGRLRKPHSLILWTGPYVHIGVAQLPQGRLFAYAVSRRIMNKDDERRLCAAALDQAPTRLTSELRDVDGAAEDTWFPFERLGYRACRPSGTDVLRWGSSLLRLHPLTGQHLSYWAIQSVQLADDLARNGAPSAAFFARLDRDNARMYEQHLRAMAFHLAPSWTWRVLRRPCVLTLRVTPRLRRRAVRRLALLDFI